MAEPGSERGNANSIETRRENALIERVNKTATEEWKEIDRAIGGAVMDEIAQIKQRHEVMDEAMARQVRAALIQTSIAKAKASVSRTVTARKAAYDRAVEYLPLVEKARREIKDQLENDGKYYSDISDIAIAKWLKDNDKKAPKGQDWTGKQVRDVLFRGPEYIIAHAVLECRTRMSAKELSADFSKPFDLMRDLELEYLDIIATALDISHRLNGHRQRGVDELRQEARHVAKMVSVEQRQLGSLGMLERERLWKPFSR